jgi:hypothetical protein
MKKPTRKQITFRQLSDVCKFRRDFGINLRLIKTYICDDNSRYSGHGCCADFCKPWNNLKKAQS